MIKIIIKEFEERTLNVYNKYNQLLEIEIGHLVINKLINIEESVTDKNRRSRKTKEAQSHIDFINYFKRELNRIKFIKNEVPKDIKPLLSSYGTFYDGGEILYCTKELTVLEVLFCILNHIIHYCIGIYHYRLLYKSNEILRILAFLDILNTSIDWDFSTTLIKYFDRIYRDEIKGIIIFEPANGYKDYMIKKIKSNNFSQAIYLEPSNYVVITKELVTMGVHTIIKSERNRKDDWFSNDYINSKNLDNSCSGSSYSSLNPRIKELLLLNEINIII